MAHRPILTERQRSALFALPTDESSLLRHYTLADDDLDHIRNRRRAHNRFGFALQLCALRYPGRLLEPGECVPQAICRFLAAQLGLKADDLAPYAAREETRHEHLAALRRIYGYRNFSGRCANDLKAWLNDQAEHAKSGEDLAQRFVDECRRTQVILPPAATVERLCAEALVAAERRIEARIADRLDDETRRRLAILLDKRTRKDKKTKEKVEEKISNLIWLRQFEVGFNSAAATRLLERLEFLQALAISPDVLRDVPPHRITQLRRQGERYFTDGLQDITENRKLAILAVCAVEWESAIADAVVETHDRIVGKTWNEAKKLCAARIEKAKDAVLDTLKAFTNFGSSLLEAHNDGAELEQTVSASPGWEGLQQLVATGARLTNTMSASPMAHVVQGYRRFRLYAPRMLAALQIEKASVAEPLMAAAALITKEPVDAPRTRDFLLRNSKWRRHLNAQPDEDHQLWEVCVLFNLRDAFRSGDIWLRRSRRYADLKDALVPMQTVQTTARLTVPFDPHEWLEERKARMTDGLKRLAKAAKTGAIPHGSITDGVLHIERLKAAVPDGADALTLDLYKRIPETRITDILLDVDAATNFTNAFVHLRTGAPCSDRLGLLNVLLAEGLNLGLRKMAEASSSHDYWQLSRLSRWHIESDALNRALAMVVEAQAHSPIAQAWGLGGAASSDGQFFPAARHGEAMNVINAKYGQEPGLKAYTHLSDQYAPFATQTIPATVSEAPYILDGLLMNEMGRRIKEQYADTGGVNEHTFAVTSLLSYRFIPRIADLPSRRLYVFDQTAVPKQVKALVGGTVKEGLIVSNWPDILRSVATMAAGVMPPSQLLKKFAAYPRQHDLALALREIGRIERTLFIIDWILDADMQRRAQVGLNKGESHHALKNALRIGRQGEIRDRTSEGQHYRMAGLNLLAAIIIFWNTAHLDRAASQRKHEGLDVPLDLLAHVSPLGWAHILLTGQYLWEKRLLTNPLAVESPEGISPLGAHATGRKVE